MIYLDSSVALAQLLAEDRAPPIDLATYDDRMTAAARALDVELLAL